MALLRLSKTKVATKLDELAAARLKVGVLQELFEAEVQKSPKLVSIQAHLKNETEAAAKLEAAIKTAVLHYGETIKGNQLQAVWSAGRTSWDSKGLSGYAVAQPEIEKFRTVGQPTISFRKVS